MSRLSNANRRDFLKNSLAGATLASISPMVHAAGDDTLRVGLIGCGGRGTGAATQALNADKNVKLVALGDMFPDRLQRSLETLRQDEGIAKKIEVTPERCFTGFDAYRQVLAAGVDVVLLTTPPHFRAQHLKAAVEAGKHVFAEKPVAVDAPGVRSVLASCEEARKKNLAVVTGLCYRYDYAKRETMQRIHAGEIGKIVALHTTYNTGALWMHPRKTDWSDMEWQLRNWLYFTWLSGDHIVEQHIHSLDKIAWAMQNDYPVRAVGLGGRQVRTQPAYGHIFDHHAVVFEYKGGQKCFSYCRQQRGCAQDVSDQVMGTTGTCDLMKHQIVGEHSWKHPGGKRGGGDMYQNEHNELFASIRNGKPINDGEIMCKSTLMAIMGRMATYTGQVITWDMAVNSHEDMTPQRYELGSLPTPPIPLPGITKFV